MDCDGREVLLSKQLRKRHATLNRFYEDNDLMNEISQWLLEIKID
jgi:hypothetical protein